jgi:hypothetical protein
LAEELRTLGGEIETQFIFRPKETDFPHALAAVKADQELVCGYKLIMIKERSMELADAHGPFVEVFVTFAPYPTVTEAQAQADPSLRPPAAQVSHTVPDGTIVMVPVPDGTKII